MGGVVQSHNSGQYIVYADHSRTGVATSLSESSASPAAKMTMFRGQKLGGSALHFGVQVMPESMATAPRPAVALIRTTRVVDPLGLLPSDLRRQLPAQVPCEATFEWLSEHAPRALAAVIDAGLLRPADLTFAAEALGRCADSDLVRATLVKLLRHPSAVVREGALYGLAEHADEAVRGLFARMSTTDPSPAVRDVAREAYERV